MLLYANLQSVVCVHALRSIGYDYLLFIVTPACDGGNAHFPRAGAFEKCVNARQGQFLGLSRKPDTRKIHMRCAVDYAQPLAPGGHVAIRLCTPFPRAL